MVPTIYVLSKKMKMIKNINLSVIFTAVRYLSIFKRACHRKVITSVINVIDESSRLPSEMPLL